MSAAAATIVMVMMFVVAAFVIAAFVIATTVIATTTTATATACHVLDQVLNLLFGCLAVLNNLSLEVQGLACQWVVGIYGYSIFLDLYNFGHELMVLVVHQGDDSTLEDVVVVEMAIHGEYFAANLVYALCYIFAESLCRSQLKIKVAALLKAFYLLLESIKCYAEAGDELEWTVIACLLFQLALAILQAV